MKNARISLKAVALGSCAFGALMAAAAPAAAEEFAVSAQELRPALQLFASQGDQQVLFSSAAVAGKRTAGFTGDASPETALQQLLSGTDLIYSKTAEGALLVMTKAEAQTRRPQLVQAAEGGDGREVDALIVTAQKREEDIQDVPIAMSAFSQEDLTRSQIAGGPDLMTQIPNMTFTKTNFASYSIQIRGIGTQAISATTDPAVAVAFNNTPFVRNRFFEQEFYDLQRIEVLRGPQGTLYGRNATAGVVNIISAKPKFVYEAKLSGDLGNYSSRRLEGMVNIPLVEDVVALRFAGAWTKRDGYATNELTGNSIDGRDLWSTRLSLRFAPTDRLDANLIWEHFEEDDDRLRSGKQLCKKDLVTEIGGVPMPPIGSSLLGSPAATYSQGCAAASLYADESYQTPNGHSLPYYLALSQLGLPVFVGLDPYLNATQSRDLRVIESTIDPVYRANSDLVELQVSFDLTDSLSLASETAYSADTIWSMQDYNRFSTAPHAFNENATFGSRLQSLFEEGGVFCDPQLGCSDRVLAADLSTAKSRQFSQELRLSSDFDSPFNFNLGANFLRYDTEDKYYVFINTLTMTTANQPLNSQPSPWVPGVTDGLDCMYSLKEGDATKIQQLVLTGNCMYIDPNPIESLNDDGHNYFLSKNPYKLISYAVFGEAYYNITENLKVTAGLRMTVDKKEAPIIPSWLLAPQTIGYPVLEVVRQEWREPTGRLTLDWKPDLAFTDETLLYASYAHGYKAGGANPPPSTIVTYLSQGADVQLNKSLTHPRTFGPEFIDAYEVGAKNTLLDGSVTLNVNAFYYDYTGYQISQIVDRSASNLNFDAEVWGAEIEADWRPIESLRLGFKGGYENTRVADGMQAIDLMDRTAGNPDWVVAKPFPTIPSNCIVPVYVVAYGDRINVPPGRLTPNPGPCISAYQLGRDPVTELAYVPNPTVRGDPGDPSSPNRFPLEAIWAGYAGFDPATAPNNGEGFAKDLSGNELPNAPHFTATLTADYTAPLRGDWLLTLHGDLYYQSEAWTRIFNMEGYDKLKAYSNVNLAAIFANEESGWNLMAYVKNVMDRDSITGAFLNSDDTGLTTNVFLTEPRLYGLRVSKTFSGGSLLGSFGARHDGPYPITVEFGGSALRTDGGSEPMSADELDAFTPTLLPDSLQDRDLDWGDGGEARLTYRHAGTPWRVSAGVRFGKANGDAKGIYSELADQEKVCGESLSICQNPLLPNVVKYNTIPTNSSWLHTSQSDDHRVVDFMVGRDFGMGAGDFRSSLSGGLSHVRLRSRTELNVKGIPDWVVENEFAYVDDTATHHWYDATLTSERDFEGMGPVAIWEASQRLRGDEQSGSLNLAWTVGGGVLLGKQNVDLTGDILSNYYSSRYNNTYAQTIDSSERIAVERRRSKSVTVPTANLSLGLTYEVDRFKVGAGYRWERYFNAIDGGDREHKDFDRTIDGPYFKFSLGFGG
jgi:iron complex outermembrane receptor protein